MCWVVGSDRQHVVHVSICSAARSEPILTTEVSKIVSET